MELLQIKYFLALSEELHFWKTAERVSITQSALSRHVKALEDELGVQLFERNKRNVKLTEAGVFLREQWKPLLDDISRIHAQAKKIHQGASGMLRIGYPGSTAFNFMPELINSIGQILPDLRVELTEPTDVSFEELLLNYRMDLALRRDPAENASLASELLYSESFALVVPFEHPLNEENFEGLHQLKDKKFILSNLSQNTFYTTLLRNLLDDYQLSPDVYVETDFGAMTLGLVGRGLGITILPSSYSHSGLPHIRFIPLPYQMNLYATWRKNDHSAVLTNVLEQVRKLAVKFGGKPEE